MAIARLHVEGFGELTQKLEKLGNDNDKIAKRALYEGARVIADAIKSGLQGAIKGPSTGELSASLGIATMQSANGSANTVIGFDGYDSKGVPNALKARAKESGTSKQPKTPFIRPAVNASKEAAASAMIEEAERLINEKLNS